MAYSALASGGRSPPCPKSSLYDTSRTVVRKRDFPGTASYGIHAKEAPLPEGGYTLLTTTSSPSQSEALEKELGELVGIML
jgi:hypothetical protein